MSARTIAGKPTSRPPTGPAMSAISADVATFAFPSSLLVGEDAVADLLDAAEVDIVLDSEPRPVCDDSPMLVFVVPVPDAVVDCADGCGFGVVETRSEEVKATGAVL